MGMIDGPLSFSYFTILSLLQTPRATRLFCDVYNPQSKTYCKRLQVLCPEHSRDPKVSFSLNSSHSVNPPFLTALHPFLPPLSFLSYPTTFIIPNWLITSYSSPFPCLFILY